MAKDKLLHRHIFNFNPSSNGGESLFLITEYYHNGDTLPDDSPDPNGIWTKQKLELNSYCNSASINLQGISIDGATISKLLPELMKAEFTAQQNALKLSQEQTE